MKSKSLRLSEYKKKVVEKPKYHWWIKGLEAYWKYLTENHLKTYKGTKLNWECELHLEAIRIAAQAGWGLENTNSLETRYWKP